MAESFHQLHQILGFLMDGTSAQLVRFDALRAALMEHAGYAGAIETAPGRPGCAAR